MRLLLDTHAFLWFMEGDQRLSVAAKELIEQPSNELFLSVGSLWEMAIKISLGKLILSATLDEVGTTWLSNSSIRMLGITIEHLKRVAEMPFLHRDPFDRLIVAQGAVDNLIILSADGIFELYGVQRRW